MGVDPTHKHAYYYHHYRHTYHKIHGAHLSHIRRWFYLEYQNSLSFLSGSNHTKLTVDWCLQLTSNYPVQSTMDIYQLTDYLETEQYAEFIECVQNITWHYGAPGGFVTNHPNRQVNAFGNGGPISAAGTPQQGGCN